MESRLSTTVIQKLIDLELISKLRADVQRYKRRKLIQQQKDWQAA